MFAPQKEVYLSTLLTPSRIDAPLLQDISTLSFPNISNTAHRKVLTYEAVTRNLLSCYTITTYMAPVITSLTGPSHFCHPCILHPHQNSLLFLNIMIGETGACCNKFQYISFSLVFNNYISMRLN